MGKAFGLILLLAALWVGMQIYNEGLESVYGGIFAPLQSDRDGSTTPMAHLTPGAQAADAPEGGGSSERLPVTERVRRRVSADYEEGARRRGY